MKNENQTPEIKRRSNANLSPLLLWLTHLNIRDGSDGEADIGQPPKALVDSIGKRGKRNNNTVRKTEMKKFKNTYKILAALILLLVASIGAKAQVGSLTRTDDQVVCIGSVEPYGVVDVSGGVSSFTWTITPADGGTISGTTNLIDVTWTKVGTYELRVVERNASGCEGEPTTLTITVNPLNTIALSSAVGTDSQTICVNTPVTDITYITTGATGADVTGLPTGLSGSWATNVVTITGAPTVSGTFSYTVTLTGGCGNITATGTITVNPDNTIALSSAAGTDSQTVCIDNAVTNVTYATTGATGATVTGLPTGLTGSWAADVFTITGIPTVSGTFSYTVTTTGGCGTATATGTFDVLPANTIALSSASGTDSQTVCIDNAVTNVTYATTGATDATVTGLPTGLTGSWAADVFTITGIPTVSGTFSYTVTTTGGCGTATATGTFDVLPANTIALSSASGTDSQTVCIDNAVTNVTYATTGATGATVTGLPTGLTGSWAADVFTITGIPTVSGTFSYTVTTTGGCGTATATGTFEVLPANTIALSSASGTDSQTVCINSLATDIKYTTTGATGATVTGLPTGLTGSWVGDVFTITGTPSISGTFSYTVTTTGGCGTATATGIITVVPLPDPLLDGPTPVCESTTNSVYKTDAGMTNYIWTVTSGGTITAGGTVSDSTVTVTWVTPGSQTVTVNYTNSFGCTAATSSKYEVIVNPLPKTSPIYHK